MKIIHLSDLHIGINNNHKRVASIVEWIASNRETHESETVVVSGDFVNDGESWQYEEAREHITALKKHGFNVLCVPGNHDYGKMGLVESRRAQQYFKEYISGEVDYPSVEIIDEYAFVLLDSMLSEMKWDHDIGPDWGAQGAIGETQLSALDKALRDIESDHAISKSVLILHHHPFHYGDLLVLRDSFDLKKVIAPSGKGRVNCVLFGHKHYENRLTEKEEKYGIDLIFCAGSSTDYNRTHIPVIDLRANEVVEHAIGF